MSKRVGVLTWDRKESLDVNALASVLHDLTDGRIVIQEVDTGSDKYGIVLAAHPIGGVDAANAYKRWQASDGRTYMVEVG